MCLYKRKYITQTSDQSLHLTEQLNNNLAHTCCTCYRALNHRILDITLMDTNHLSQSRQKNSKWNTQKQVCIHTIFLSMTVILPVCLTWPPQIRHAFCCSSVKPVRVRFRFRLAWALKSATIEHCFEGISHTSSTWLLNRPATNFIMQQSVRNSLYTIRKFIIQQMLWWKMYFTFVY